jgi:hypothetical protein
MGAILTEKGRFVSRKNLGGGMVDGNIILMRWRLDPAPDRGPG